jgi:hypothetical protein
MLLSLQKCNFTGCEFAPRRHLRHSNSGLSTAIGCILPILCQFKGISQLIELADAPPFLV